MDRWIKIQHYCHILWMCSLVTCLYSCLDMEEEWYDQPTFSQYYKTKENVEAAFRRPFSHAAFPTALGLFFDFRLQECTADQFVFTQKGKHWYDGGENHRFLHHEWTADEEWIWEMWSYSAKGIALIAEVEHDLKTLDYKSLNMSENDRRSHLAELKALNAYFYLRALDFFGPFVILKDMKDATPRRSSDKLIFTHIERLLNEAMPDLEQKTEGQLEEGAIRQAAAATFLARLYFNAKAYIGEERFDDCAKICENILAGKYGAYKLDEEWYGPHTFYNKNSNAVIWSFPSAFNKQEYNWFYMPFYHYNSSIYFNIDGGANNGGHLQPSFYPGGMKSYVNEFKLGRPFDKFHDKDLRKRPFSYKGDGIYEGMFLIGNQVSPITGEQVLGTQEYKDEPLVFVDYVALMKTLKEGQEPITLRSTISDGEENTGIRMVKVPIPDQSDNLLRWEADCPVIRLEEIYYMLAECLLRKGNKARAADIINRVRSRAFQNGNDPDPVTETNLDKYRMIDEWGIEFLGEYRRRTDLIRWNMFTTERWWDHEPSDPSRNRFPVPIRAISGNHALELAPIE